MGIGEKYYYKWLRGKLSSWQMATSNPFDLSSRFGCYFLSLESLLVLWLVLTRRRRQSHLVQVLVHGCSLPGISPFISFSWDPAMKWKSYGQDYCDKREKANAVYTGVQLLQKECHECEWSHLNMLSQPHSAEGSERKGFVFLANTPWQRRKLSQLTEKKL